MALCSQSQQGSLAHRVLHPKKHKWRKEGGNGVVGAGGVAVGGRCTWRQAEENRRYSWWWGTSGCGRTCKPITVGTKFRGRGTGWGRGGWGCCCKEAGGAQQRRNLGFRWETRVAFFLCPLHGMGPIQGRFAVSLYLNSNPQRYIRAELATFWMHFCRQHLQKTVCGRFHRPRSWRGKRTHYHVGLQRPADGCAHAGVGRCCTVQPWNHKAKGTVSVTSFSLT